MTLWIVVLAMQIVCLGFQLYVLFRTQRRIRIIAADRKSFDEAVTQADAHFDKRAAEIARAEKEMPLKVMRDIQAFVKSQGGDGFQISEIGIEDPDGTQHPLLDPGKKGWQ